MTASVRAMVNLDEPDSRFLLANERTFLAYIRTTLAVQIAGLGTMQFLTSAPDVVRFTVSITLVLAGSALGLVSYGRWRHNDLALRAGLVVSRPRHNLAIALTVAIIPACAAVTTAIALVGPG